MLGATPVFIAEKETPNKEEREVKMKLLFSLLLMVATVSSLELDWLVLWKLERHRPSNMHSGLHCLNGGSFIPFVHNSEKGFCMCPEQFRGIRCDIDQSASQCFSGNGQDYRGTVARSEGGKRCLLWDIVNTVPGARENNQGLGGHNYCRNPDQSARPWCWVWMGHKVTQSFCKIPRCEEKQMPTCGERPQKRHKIVGGAVTTVEAHPWIASIFHKVRSSRTLVFRCGGTLISPCWVLSAAHCFPDGAHTSVRRLSVILGKNAINETDGSIEQEFHVEKVVIHEGFDNRDGNFDNDIALLKIRGIGTQCAEQTRAVRTICLPPAHQMLPPGVFCDVVGYGKESERIWYNSQYLREAKVKLLAQDICTDKDYYGSLVTKNMFCAGSPDWSKDACKGDSGGPLVCEVDNRMFLFGIVSWGEGCSREFRPGVYTRVTNYNKWIEEKTGLSSITSGSMYPQK
ncbi:hypothetical protein AAFF_G00139060 [Aldrovandia affinis]|uniref:Urokinase-type plasminogen activator n=1 Tax=Aldrovandia affinis TaxID=143900 RepID=A0AAD7X2M9_9TELE|nr:hypothetical protein AAFF_G00139060 [Aldrovandia affinis]